MEQITEISISKPNERQIFKKLNAAFKQVTSAFGDEFVLGVFAYGADYDIEAIVIPAFSDVCLNSPLVYTVIGDVVVKDVRLIYNATNNGHGEIIEALYTDYYIVAPRYEFVFQKLLRCNREAIRRGIECGTPAIELKLALTKILRTAWNDTSKTVIFIKQLTDVDKLALEGIIETIGDEGLFSQAKVASAIGVSRLAMTNLVQKMQNHEVAEVTYLGPKGTYIKILDSTLLNIRGENNV